MLKSGRAPKWQGGARRTALRHAERLSAQDIDLHKQLVNRLLEPFAWITVIITATEWANFFTQRCHPDAQPEIKHIAESDAPHNIERVSRSPSLRAAGIYRSFWTTNVRCPTKSCANSASLVARGSPISRTTASAIAPKEHRTLRALWSRGGAEQATGVRSSTSRRRPPTRGSTRPTSWVGSNTASSSRKSTPRRFPTNTPLRSQTVPPMLAALLFVLFVPALAGAQSREDRHVTAMSAQTLLHASAVTLVDPFRQRRARAISDYQELLFGGWALAPILAFWWLWQSGNSARLRAMLRRRMRSPWLIAVPSAHRSERWQRLLRCRLRLPRTASLQRRFDRADDPELVSRRTAACRDDVGGDGARGRGDPGAGRLHAALVSDLHRHPLPDVHRRRGDRTGAGLTAPLDRPARSGGGRRAGRCDGARARRVADPSDDQRNLAAHLVAAGANVGARAVRAHSDRRSSSCKR